jgi:EAL domain-containing protein (putative c-di-GMP-specific phosphodiesterase class I)
MNIKKLEKKVSKMDFAFQPIVDINTGLTLAYEALLRDYTNAGYKSIDSVFDSAYKNKTLHALDLLLREKVLEKIKPLYEINKNFKIFYNLDNRIDKLKEYYQNMTIIYHFLLLRYQKNISSSL